MSVALDQIDNAGGVFVRVVITDDGVGFEPALAANLFERGQSSKGRSGGLGLHWCANTVKAMGGALSLESEGPGTGARAIVLLPAAAHSQPASRPSAGAQAA